MTINLY